MSWLEALTNFPIRSTIIFANPIRNFPSRSIATLRIYAERYPRHRRTPLRNRLSQASDLEPGSPVQRLGIKTGFKNDTMWNHKLTKLKFDFVEKSKG